MALFVCFFLGGVFLFVLVLIFGWFSFLLEGRRFAGVIWFGWVVCF